MALFMEEKKDNLSSIFRQEHNIKNNDLSGKILSSQESQSSCENTENRKKMENLLNDIRKYSSWDGNDAKRKLYDLENDFLSEFPNHQRKLEEAIKNGESCKKFLKKSYELGSNGKYQYDFNKLMETLPPDTPSEIKYKMKKEFEKGRKKHERFKDEKRLKKSGKPLASVNLGNLQISKTIVPQEPITKTKEFGPYYDKSKLHPNDIRGLQPCNKWQLIIDETGSVFDEQSRVMKSSSKLGRCVAVLMPENIELPKLTSRWHAVEQRNLAEIDKLIQVILDNKVGVLGIDVNSLPNTFGERWMDTVVLLIDLVIRLMPIENKTRLDVLIEERGQFSRSVSWDLVSRDCLLRLALAFPSRAAKLDLNIRTISKDGSDLNGYTDAIAFTWAKTSDSSKERLAKTKWEGTCLLNSYEGVDSKVILNIWDAFAQGVNLSPANWWDILNSPDVNNEASILNSFIRRLGEEAKSKVDIWRIYLNELELKMAASPINLYKMSAAINWLQDYKPEKAEILPKMRLIWLTVKLARANHFGETEQKFKQELKTLAEQLFDECAPLVCHADLHLAVSATNRFAFEEASKILERWKNRSAAEPGLQYWGQIKSSLGQHSAFLGDNRRAVEFFKEALSAFSRLSDPHERIVNQTQTGTYLAISMTDESSFSDADVKDAVQKITGELESAGSRLAQGIPDPDRDRYIHHLLLRWLVHRGDENIKNIYLRYRNDWKTGKGHPWPLIQLYRAILLKNTDIEAAKSLAIDASKIAFDSKQGPTVRLIGASCLAIANSWGHPCPEADGILQKLKEELPLALDRIEILSKWLKNPETDELKLLRSVLPFNFR